jgi:hypothetical protein
MISMKRVLAILLLVVVLCWDLYCCQEARADWSPRPASLTHGTYMITYIELGKTAHFLVMQALGQMDIILPLIDLRTSRTFEVNDEINTKTIADFLNSDPMTEQEQEPIIFHLQSDGTWKQVPLPCRWVAEGNDLLL